MILGDATQPFASPGEALEHYGVKGMRWGVRKDDKGGARKGSAVPGASLNPKGKLELQKVDLQIKEGKAAAKANTETKGLTPLRDTTSRSGEQEPKAADQRGLTSTQKKVLVGLGVTAGVAGYIAYKHYAKQPLVTGPPQNWRDSFSTSKVGFNPKKLSREQISKRKIGDLAEGHRGFALLHPEKLHVDISKGYADITPIGGFANPQAVKSHREMIESLDAMRAKYPAIRNMNIEVVPMSHQPDFGADLAKGAHAAVLSMRPGEARVYYNDVMEAPSAWARKAQEQFTPGIFQKGGLGAHEMGHLLAVAGGRQKPSFDLQTMPEKNALDYIAKNKAFANYKKEQHELHKDLFIKHGFTFSELSKLSGYAKTEPAEALAELSRFYHAPPTGVKTNLTPEQRAKAKRLFDDLGGLTVDSVREARDLAEVG